MGILIWKYDNKFKKKNGFLMTYCLFFAKIENLIMKFIIF